MRVSLLAAWEAACPYRVSKEDAVGEATIGYTVFKTTRRDFATSTGRSGLTDACCSTSNVARLAEGTKAIRSISRLTSGVVYHFLSFYSYLSRPTEDSFQTAYPSETRQACGEA